MLVKDFASDCCSISLQSHVHSVLWASGDFTRTQFKDLLPNSQEQLFTYEYALGFGASNLFRIIARWKTKLIVGASQVPIMLNQSMCVRLLNIKTLLVPKIFAHQSKLRHVRTIPYPPSRHTLALVLYMTHSMRVRLATRGVYIAGTRRSAGGGMYSGAHHFFFRKKWRERTRSDWMAALVEFENTPCESDGIYGTRVCRERDREGR